MWQKVILAKSVDEVLAALAENGESARIIAGGTDLILEIEREVRPNVSTLIDISQIPGLDAITLDEQGLIHLGPLVTHNHVLASALIREHAFALLQSCWEVGSPQIRNRGTIAGNLVTASPANDTISPLMALNAELTLRSASGSRVVPLSAFYTGVRKTVMAPDEMVTDIAFKKPGPQTRTYFIKTALRKAQAISVINVSVLLTLDSGQIQDARVTLGAAAPTIIHAEEAEAFLKGKTFNPGVDAEALIQNAGELAASAAQPISDVRGSAAYRDYMIAVITRKALNAILKGVDKTTIPADPVLLMGTASGRDFQPAPFDGSEIHTRINGKDYHFKTGFEKTLLRLIREEAGLTGTKEGCAEGECGACTVFLDGRAVMSCLVPAPRAHGAEIVTVEGLADSDEHLHPVQQAFVDHGAVQCGYCTPGFVMSAVKLLEERQSPSQTEIRQAITGNLCRCTGYYKIIEAIESASRTLAGGQED